MKLGVVPLTGTTSEKHMQEDLDVFSIDLTMEEVEKNWAEPNYAKFWNDILGNSTTIVANHLFVNSKPKTSKNVLEIACGAGQAAKILREMLPEKTKLTISDFSEAMLEHARNNLKGKDISIVKENAESLSFKDNTFDRVISNFCLHLVPNPEKMLQNVFRVLEKDGITAMSVWGRKENSPMFTIVPEIINDVLGDSAPKQIQKRSPFHLSDKDHLIQMFKEAGFVNIVAFYTFSNQPRAIDAEDYLSHPLPSVAQKQLNSLNEEQKNRFQSLYKQRVSQYFDNNSVIGMESLIIIAKKPK